MALAIRSIKYWCIRNSGAFPSATKQTQPSAPDPEPYSLPYGEAPPSRPLSRQELAFFCGRAQMPGLKWCWATTAFRNQKSWVPNTFLEELNPHLHFPVQCSQHQVRLTFSLVSDPFSLHSDTASTGGEEKHCGKKNSTANPCDIQSPLWLVQSMQQFIPGNVYGTEIQAMAQQLHHSSFLRAYRSFTSRKMR